MAPHKFQVGDLVSYRQPMHGGEQGVFQIETLIPANAVENQYRVVRPADRRRRFAGESELSISASPPVGGRDPA